MIGVNVKVGRKAIDVLDARPILSALRVKFRAAGVISVWCGCLVRTMGF